MALINHPAYDRPATDSPGRALDVERLREEFPQVVRTWEQLNIRERAEFVTAENRRKAGL